MLFSRIETLTNTFAFLATICQRWLSKKTSNSRLQESIRNSRSKVLFYRFNYCKSIDLNNEPRTKVLGNESQWERPLAYHRSRAVSPWHLMINRPALPYCACARLSVLLRTRFARWFASSPASGRAKPISSVIPLNHTTVIIYKQIAWSPSLLLRINESLLVRSVVVRRVLSL